MEENNRSVDSVGEVDGGPAEEDLLVRGVGADQGEDVLRLELVGVLQQAGQVGNAVYTRP